MHPGPTTLFFQPVPKHRTYFSAIVRSIQWPGKSLVGCYSGKKGLSRHQKKERLFFPGRESLSFFLKQYATRDFPGQSIDLTVAEKKCGVQGLAGKKDGLAWVHPQVLFLLAPTILDPTPGQNVLTNITTYHSYYYSYFYYLLLLLPLLLDTNII